MKVYIAGRISGDPGYRGKFEVEQRKQEAAGNVVLNPAILPKGLTVGDYMKICFTMIDVADVVLFLPDWQISGGAQLEKAYCDYTDKPYKLIEQKEEQQ